MEKHLEELHKLRTEWLERLVEISKEEKELVSAVEKISKLIDELE